MIAIRAREISRGARKRRGSTLGIGICGGLRRAASPVPAPRTGFGVRVRGFRLAVARFAVAGSSGLHYI